MANEIQVPATSGASLYAVILNASGLVWDGGSFVIPSGSQWSSYALRLSEATATGLFESDFPVAITLMGRYGTVAYQQRDSIPSVGDPVAATGSIDWAGTAVAVPVAADAQGRVTPAATPPTASEIAVAVWEQTQASHNNEGTFGALVDARISTRSTFNPTLNAVHLSASGLDQVAIEQSVNARQALSAILAANAGVLSGAGTGSIIIRGANVPTTRIMATTDDVGNRQVVTLNLPS